jgi:hypothetical protein
VDAAATAEPNPKEALQAAGYLAVGQAALLVEFNDGSLGIGSKLGGGGAEDGPFLAPTAAHRRPRIGRACL